MRETSVISFVQMRSVRQVFTAMGKKKISCHHLQDSVVQVRHRQEKVANPLENGLDIYPVNPQIIVFKSPTALFVDCVCFFFGVVVDDVVLRAIGCATLGIFYSAVAGGGI